MKDLLLDHQFFSLKRLAVKELVPIEVPILVKVLGRTKEVTTQKNSEYNGHQRGASPILAAQNGDRGRGVVLFVMFLT